MFNTKPKLDHLLKGTVSVISNDLPCKDSQRFVCWFDQL